VHFSYIVKMSDIEDECKKDFNLENLEIVKTIGTGTFSRVSLCREKRNRDYYALKVLAIQDLIRLKQVDHIKNEKNLLEDLRHPFIVELCWCHKDRSFLYMLFPYIAGGELFSYLRSSGRFSSTTSLFYSAEIVNVLEYLHTTNVVYRDLKPENLMLDPEGHLKIIDFGFAKRVTENTWTLCGTPEYLAPEIIQSKGHDKAVDWWALGILMYEMLAGYPPFYDENPFGIYEKVLSGKIDWPRHIDQIAKDLIKKLLVQDRGKRLGNMKNGTEDVMRHKWFKTINWEEVYQRKLKPPIIPKIGYEGDTRNFDVYPETDIRNISPVTDREARLFDEF